MATRGKKARPSDGGLRKNSEIAAWLFTRDRDRIAKQLGDVLAGLDISETTGRQLQAAAVTELRALPAPPLVRQRTGWTLDYAPVPKHLEPAAYVARLASKILS